MPLVKKAVKEEFGPQYGKMGSEVQSSLLLLPEPLLKMVYTSIDIIDTIREKRTEESEKVYMLLHIAGAVPSIGASFPEGIEGLFANQHYADRIRGNDATVRELIQHIKIHAINAYSAKLKKNRIN